MEVTDDTKPDPATAARRLLRGARAGTLATSDAGQPFASLVTPATAPDASVLLLLSGLSPHTRHLRHEKRCSLLVMGPPTSINPQTAPRLTLIGTAQPEADPALKARWVALHPYAAFYADLGDFTLWRLRPVSGQFVGGFASAHRFMADDLAPDPIATAALAPAEASVIERCNANRDALDGIARAMGADGSGWRMVAYDPDGADLAREEQVLRVHWRAPAASPEAVRAEVGHLADAAQYQ